MARTGQAYARALRAWGAPLPEWVEALAQACDARSLRKAAAILDVSPALVSLALNRRHLAKTDYIEERVRRTLLARNVHCPVLGPVSGDKCRETQQQPIVTANPLCVRLRRTCRTCPHRQKEDA